MENRYRSMKNRRKTGRVPRRDGQKCELLKIIDTTENVVERGNAGAINRIIEGWEHLVKIKASRSKREEVHTNGLYQSSTIM